MFGYRSDGKKVKKIDHIYRLVPHIMTKRSDAQVFYSQDLPLASLDEYIAKKEKEGIKLSYMNIIYACMVRLLAEKPRLNRFVMEDGRIYKRNAIYVSFMIKKGMSVEGEESAIKIPFDGSENIFEIKEKMDSEVNKNKDAAAENDTDKLAKVLGLIPNFILKFIVTLFKVLDKYGILPKAIINASPFHTSAFLTNVGSLGIDSIYHHIYNFGNTGIFVAMGKKKKSYIYEEDNIIEGKSISLSIVGDERICDGYYFANAMKSFYRYMKKPELLETNVEPTKDVD